MTLYVRGELRRDGWGFSHELAAATLRDKLAARGWVECGTCRGCGMVPEKGVPEPTEDPCPDCVEGLVPPEGMVEAAAEAVWHSSGHAHRSAARGVLIAAARWEREQ